MPSLPTPTVDPPDLWGAAMNTWLLVARNADGTLKDGSVHPSTLTTGGAAGTVPAQDGAGGWTWVTLPVSSSRVVRVAATGNVSIVAPGATIDGVTMADGDRVLLPAQTTASQNGIYDYHSGGLVRSADSDTSPEITPMIVQVSEGSTNADKIFQLTTDAPITLGTTALTFTPLAFGGGSGTFLTPVAVKTTNYISAAGELVPVDTTSGNVTVTLPTAPADKTTQAVKHVIQGGSNAVTIARGGSDVFNKTGGSTSLTLKSVNQSVLLEYRAANSVWYVVATDEAVLGLGTTKGDLIAFDAAGHMVRVAVGADGDILTSDSSTTSGLRMATPVPPTMHYVFLGAQVKTYVGAASPTRASPDSVNDSMGVIDLTGMTQVQFTARTPNAYPASTWLAPQYWTGSAWRYFELAQDDTLRIDASTAYTADQLPGVAPSVGAFKTIEVAARAIVYVRLALYGGTGGNGPGGANNNINMAVLLAKP